MRLIGLAIALTTLPVAAADARPATQAAAFPDAAIADATDAADVGPLDAWADALGDAGLPDDAARRDRLRRAQAALEQAAAPAADCAATLGASRFAALHGAVARAREALGDRDGARLAWRAALDCAPRDAEPHAALARLQMIAGERHAAAASLARALRLQPGLEIAGQRAAQLAYLDGRWGEAARRADAIAATHLAEAHRQEGEAGLQDDGRTEPVEARHAAAYWRMFALLARRRGGLPPPDGIAEDAALGGSWPAPLWRHLALEPDEAGLVAAIDAEDDARRRREMACEALYYTAQQRLAAGQTRAGLRRLARVVNLKVLHFVEHDLALAELAARRPGASPGASGP